MVDKAGQARRAVSAYRDAAAVRDRLEERLGDKAELHRELAERFLELGPPLAEVGLRDEVVKSYQMALSHARKLREAAPRGRESRDLFARVNYHLATLHRWDAEAPEEKVKAARLALGLFEELAAEFPTDFAFARIGAECVYILARIEFAAGHYGEAEELCRQAIARGEKLLRGPCLAPDSERLANAEYHHGGRGPGGRRHADRSARRPAAD